MNNKTDRQQMDQHIHRQTYEQTVAQMIQPEHRQI